MQHAGARQTITRLLAGSSLGGHAALTILAGELLERLPGALADGLWAKVSALPPDEAPACPCVQNQAPIPTHESELIAQLAPHAVANPGDTGLTIALLAGLADLWPHVSSAERPLLRTRFYNGMIARAEAVGTRDGVPREALVTTSELKVWNRYMPTATGDGGSTSELPRLLTAPTAQEAYHLLADHLIGGMDLGILARILGSLAVQIADQRADPAGILLHPLIGGVAAQRLAALTPPESYSALLSQLAHQLWWSANPAGLPRRATDEPSTDNLAGAIRSGAAGSARRRTRIMQLDETGWWDMLTPVILELAGEDAEHLRRAITATWTLAVRSSNRIIAPDDVAAIAAILADGA